MKYAASPPAIIKRATAFKRIWSIRNCKRPVVTYGLELLRRFIICEKKNIFRFHPKLIRNEFLTLCCNDIFEPFWNLTIVWRLAGVEALFVMGEVGTISATSLEISSMHFRCCFVVAAILFMPVYGYYKKIFQMLFVLQILQKSQKKLIVGPN